MCDLQGLGFNLNLYNGNKEHFIVWSETLQILKGVWVLCVLALRSTRLWGIEGRLWG
jgi:hypothetical protein